MKTISRLFFFGFFIFCFLSYHHNPDEILIETLKGVWVKTTNNSDTIRFSMIEHLDHDFELTLAGVPHPQGGPAGLYEFKTLGTTMLIGWIARANSGATSIDFYLDRDAKQMMLGNFYNADKEGQMLTFVKVD